MNKALLVGINKYPDSPLRGCINDCLLMHKILTEKYSFDITNVKTILDGDATKINILKGLNDLVLDTKPGDTIYFHYSGHGSQIVVNDWTNSSEVDGRDEIIVNVDIDWRNPIRDNDIGSIFKKVPEGVKILVVLDSCHSGTGLRNLWKTPEDLKTERDWVNRFYPPPPSNILTNPKISIDDDLNFVLPVPTDDIQTQKGMFLVDTIEQGNAILISGCRDNETSADAWIGKRYHGALTYTMVQILKNNNFNITYNKLISDINANMDRSGYTQNPQLECKKEFFENSFLG